MRHEVTVRWGRLQTVLQSKKSARGRICVASVLCCIGNSMKLELLGVAARIIVAFTVFIFFEV